MKIKQLALLLSLTLLALYFPSASYAEQAMGDSELVLSGGGTSPSGFHTTNASANAQYGYFLSKAWEIGVRQAVSFDDVGDSSFVNGATYVFTDAFLDLNAWQPFIGASAGVDYGPLRNEHFIVGPEAGVKYYVKEKTFIIARAAYLFDVNNSVDEGNTVYTLGIGFNF